MPKTIYETPRVDEHGPQGSLVPSNWAYIGETIAALNSDAWEWVPVNNRASNAWILLNAVIDLVDYAITDIKYDRATLNIVDENNPDYMNFALKVKDVASNTNVINRSLPDDTDTYLMTGLSQLKTYEVSLQVWDSGGVLSAPSIQRFTTPKNPAPLAPLNLRSTAQANSWIDLVWDSAPGDTATAYWVYVEQDDFILDRDPIRVTRNLTGSTKYRVINLKEDRRYGYTVYGVNEEGIEGLPSNTIRWATGHDSKTSRGSLGEYISPFEWGSWRPDIKWYYWKHWPSRKINNPNIYQGYWQGDPDYSGPTLTTVTSQESGRYWGCVTYDIAGFRQRVDAKHGVNVWKNINVTKTEIRKIYRWRQPGNQLAQYMQWQLTNTNIFDASGQPPLYATHRNSWGNNADCASSQDSMRAGTAIEWLRLPRAYGKALVSGRYAGTEVNGICLWRGDHENNYYGTAGYGKWSGHNIRDEQYPNDAWRTSDWSLYVAGEWNFQTVAYKAPYQWGDPPIRDL